LGLEGICIECGHVVGDVQIVQPIEIVVHEAGAEADGIPLAQIAVDFLGILLKVSARGVELAVVMEVVDADFKATPN
jgi:hypothetical protein